MNIYGHLWQYLAELFLNWELFQTKVLEKIKTHIFFNNVLFFGGGGDLAIYNVMWKSMVELEGLQMT
jgi:hypothetical protein